MNDVHRCISEDIVEADTISNVPAERLEQKMYFFQPVLGGEANSVSEPLYGDLIYRAGKNSVEYFRFRGLENFIAHSASSITRSAYRAVKKAAKKSTAKKRPLK